MTSDSNHTTAPINPVEAAVEEIDLMAIAKTLWAGRKTILISIIIGTVLGVFVAILTPNEYTATSIMVPQTGGKSTSSLSSLASLAGVDLGMAESAELSPVIYPKIVSSIPFKLELMNTPFNFKEFDKPVSLYDYFTQNRNPNLLGVLKKYTIGLPRVILGAIRKTPDDQTLPKAITGQPLSLTKKQNDVKKILDQCISLEVEKKDGYLTLVVRMPEAFAAAQVAQKAQELLQRDITKFKVEKSQANLDFIQERYNVAKAEAEGYQINIAVNTDKYKDLTSSVPQVKTTRIQTKYGIASGVYQELAKQLEQAKIQVKKDTPVFTIVEPVSVPLEKTKPNRPQILIFWIFLGCIIGIGLVYGKQFASEIKRMWNEK
ncbi:MAG TPA: Wzz/FepE/Etk N-terminal domain-containing protein [Bacteroidales bacterium]|nr:Wzz/FepE/Etk N-terminal domain-containing protein [Bacteroidales bacterium]